MSKRDPDLAAGVYVALVCATVLVCLVGALVLPNSISFSRWLGVFAVAGYFVGVPVLLRTAHRSRIREAVEEIGGRVARVRRLPFWKQPIYASTAFFYGVYYEVEYVDSAGVLRRAHCRSSFFPGVRWLEGFSAISENWN